MLLIIDLDGTILDSQKQHLNAFVKGLSRAGVYVNKELVEKIKSTFGMPGDEIIRVAAPDFNDIMINVLKENVGKVLYDEEFSTITLLDGAEDFLKKNSLKHSLALATSSSKKFTDMVLDKFKLRGYFKAVITRDDVNRGKPDPEMLNKAIELTGFEKSEAVFLGDTIYDYEAGIAAGIRFIAVLEASYFKKELLKKAECINTLSDLKL